MAIVTNVNVGLFGNLGTNTVVTTAGTGISKSYAYDEAQYTQTDPASAVIGTDTASLAAYFPAFTQKQIRSFTIVPVTAAGAADYLVVDLYSMQPQVFGTATATLCYNVAAIAAGQPGFLGTLMGTGVNRVRICGIIGNAGTGIGGATGTQAIGLGTAVAYNPTYVNLAGATATIIVVSPAGTNTQGGYVFPIGPNGGL